MLTQTTAHAGAYDEALVRLHRTGPEFEGWLSNHGPMAVEALARAGAQERIHRWTDDYLDRLDERPRGIDPIAEDAWRDPLGDPVRTGDWIDFFIAQVREREWRDVLAIWWPRLLPGIAAGATHGVIRTGHAVAALTDQTTQPRIDEFAHGLAYWAARWQPVPSIPRRGGRSFGEVLEQVPAVPDQRFGIRSRFAQLGEEFGTTAAQAGLASDPISAVHELTDAAVRFYLGNGHGHPTMLVHAATAPNAVARLMPQLPRDLWPATVDVVWTASAAVVAAYRPATPHAVRGAGTASPEEVMSRAVEHGDEHVIKFADTALGAFRRTGDSDMLAAAERVIELHEQAS